MDGLIKKFISTASAIPKIEPGGRPDMHIIFDAIKQMANLFDVNESAWDGDVPMMNCDSNGEQQRSTKDAVGAQLMMMFTSPETLWL